MCPPCTSHCTRPLTGAHQLVLTADVGETLLVPPKDEDTPGQRRTANLPALHGGLHSYISCARRQGHASVPAGPLQLRVTFLAYFPSSPVWVAGVQGKLFSELPSHLSQKQHAVAKAHRLWVHVTTVRFMIKPSGSTEIQAEACAGESSTTHKVVAVGVSTHGFDILPLMCS